MQWLFAAQMREKYRLPFDLIERQGLRCYRDFIAASDWLARDLRAARPGTVVDGYESGSWATIEEVQGNRAEYVLVSTKEVISGLGYARPDFYDWLVAHGEVVFRFRGRTNGDLLIYRLSVSDGMGQRGYAIP